MGFFNGMDDLWRIEGPRSHRLGMARMPKKTGGCSITGCRRTPTEWHHIIAQGRIRRRRLDPALLTDPGNLVELCGHHHAMTTASLVKGFKEREKNPGKAVPAFRPKVKKARRKKKGKRTQCGATTGGGVYVGSQCKFNAAPNEDYCRVHLRMGWGR